MKIAVINFSGNVGKSTIARHLLAPRLDAAPIFAVETINSDDHEQAAFKGKQFGEIQQGLLLLEGNAVVDVGASNVEDFVGLMKQYRGSQADFDYFVVPTVPTQKQQRDTLATMAALAEIGVPAAKIRLLFNLIPWDESPEQLCHGLFEYCARQGTFTLLPEAVIHENEIYGQLKTSTETITDIVNDPSDCKANIKTAKNAEDRLYWAQRLAIKRLALGVNAELDQVFSVLLAEPA